MEARRQLDSHLNLRILTPQEFRADFAPDPAGFY